MHTIAIFKKSSDVESAHEMLDKAGVPSQVTMKDTSSGSALFLLQAADTQTEAALKEVDKQHPQGLMICHNCGSHELNFPSTPNHTFLSRVAGKVAVKTHLVEEHVICADCRNEWTP